MDDVQLTHVAGPAIAADVRERFSRLPLVAS
jgi:hypothetical protein